MNVRRGMYCTMMHVYRNVLKATIRSALNVSYVLQDVCSVLEVLIIVKSAAMEAICTRDNVFKNVLRVLIRKEVGVYKDAELPVKLVWMMGNHALVVKMMKTFCT